MKKIKTIINFIFYEKGILQELEVLRSGLNRRVKVENEIANHLSKGTLPADEDLRSWAVELGVPEKYRRKK